VATLDDGDAVDRSGHWLTADAGDGGNATNVGDAADGGDSADVGDGGYGRCLRQDDSIAGGYGRRQR